MYTELGVDFIHCTLKAVLVDPIGNGNEDDYRWIPRSVLDPAESPNFNELATGECITILVADWFAQREGLV